MEYCMIRMNKVTKEYGKHENCIRALSEIDFKVNRGEFVAITGSSGSGKTTLLNILGCMDRLTSGSYMINGRETASLSSSEQAKIRNQTFGFVMQNYALIDHFSVYKNVELPLKYARKIKSRETRISELLKALNIEDKKNQITNSLSGGQKQRVAIARALVNDAEIILADEPTGALDTKNGIQVMEILSGLHRQGKTIIMVTHNPELLGYCSRTVKIEDGKIISDKISDKNL
ncbi:ABC transporter ATP-binding protein [Ruminococcus sp. AM46-18]|jgi:putative ABC transport system ATP-binding protein|nr:ABC transporter ATP-binding protein [Ruminococcus sp. AM46-18]